mmetsp:Transcript_8721/g.16522  ORF Transcript_8721/g.16522 Transcript_8721/m.16522 type:complete len:322 (+) Transcript_8721:64-1029(+)
MLYRSLLARTSRCLYEVLGVPRNATTAEIKQGFRDQAKQTHPDIDASAAATRSFRDITEAYRVLGDPRKRAEYDRDAAAKEQGKQGFHQYGPSGSEAFHDSGYSYQARGAAGPEPADAQLNPAGIRMEWAAVGAVSLLGLWFLLPGGRADASNRIDRDPYPSRIPGTSPIMSKHAKSTISPDAMDGSGTTSMPAGDSVVTQQGDSKNRRSQGSAPGDELVPAFYNPFTNVWQRIPDGYEPPAAMDLTAWHKKRIDSVEWSRLFAEGTLSEIIPRGGLQVRYRPFWDTYEPAIVRDPYTGKTVENSNKLPARNVQPASDIKF